MDGDSEEINPAVYGIVELPRSELMETNLSCNNESSTQLPKHGGLARSSSKIACALAGGLALLAMAFSRSNNRVIKTDPCEDGTSCAALDARATDQIEQAVDDQTMDNREQPVDDQETDQNEQSEPICTESRFASIMNWAGEVASRF
jgi:hypothetical protein